MDELDTDDATICSTTMGSIGLIWSRNGVRNLFLPGPNVAARVEAAKRGVCLPRPSWLTALCGQLQRYAAGDRVEFSEVPVDMHLVDAFRRAVYEAARRLGYGQTTTYGELAAAAGHPGMARETGAALGANPVAIVIPCHRIVAANGKLGGFSAPGGTGVKRRLLSLEMARPVTTSGGQGALAF